MKFSINQHIEPGVNPVTHPVVLFLVSLIPPSVQCSDHHQPLLSLCHWPPCWPNQSRHTWCGTHNLMHRAFQSLDAIVPLYIRFIICLPVVFARVCIIQVTIPVKPIFVVRNAFRCTILITLGWVTVYASDSAEILYLSSSSREVLCRHSWWHRLSVWQFKCSRTIMLNEWPGLFDNPFILQNVSYVSHF